ncbi:hypothetical protein BDB00DRAFT_931609 [Zychaea mexicana]|uniref:uncharacterized protein n=1 Tax=Zychaea mexicana TaxID=64656 RepID=UPI0022FE0EBC|nr:uncharacterized protein BDB00DRAFT_931609 [Zychaea mexicana]KAI9489881.1 hypothetical protein BDB00DRAFT_931609 [Zychaea mexicana]
MRSIDDIPRDDATKKRILDIIDHQFDLEIYLKHREAATIRREITKAEEALRDLKAAIESESAATDTPHYTRRSAAVASAATLASALYQSYLPNGNKATQSRSGQVLYGRRADGVYVRLSCPACKREDFANRQGFLNHCRLAHDLEFGPYEQTMLRCGTPVDESEVPLDDPARSRPVTMHIPPVKMKKKERPTIKVFEEDVDLESDRVTQNGTGENVIPPAPPPPPPPPSTSPSSSSSPRSSAHPTQGLKSIPDTATQEQQQQQQPSASSSSITSSTAQEEQQQQQPQPMESFAAAMSSSSAPSTPTGGAETGSRFYIKRQVVVGNVSKFILPEKRDPTLNKFTHKWMVYVVEPPQAQEVSKFITGVRFHLHPSYKPHDVVDVTEPPFRLTRLGWGEFPIRVQLFFVDKRRNKSVDLIHQVKLDYTHSGRQMLGGERIVEIELDRNTDFNDVSTKPVPRATSTPREELNAEDTKQQAAAIASKQKMSLLHGILKDSVRRLPIIRPASQQNISVLPYTCAIGPKQYFSWSVGRRKALEWHRAHLLRVKVQQCAFDTMDPVLRSAGAALSTKDVILWCRENQFTPQRTDINPDDQIEQDTVGFGYCKFCGCYRGHHSTDDAHCRQRPQGWNPRKRALNGMSSVDTLLDKLPAGWDTISEADDMDVDIGSETTNTGESKRTSGKALIETIRESIQQENGIDEGHVDWIWSVIAQLPLKGVVANAMIQDRDGTLRGPTRDFEIVEAMDQRLVTGSLFAGMVRVFLKRILQSALDVYQKQRQQEQEEQEQEEEDDEEEGEEDERGEAQTEKLLVPVHIYEGILQNQEFDFLTNQYMGPSSLSSLSLTEQQQREDIVGNNRID